MRIAIMQPYFFPYIGYWQLMHAVDRFIIYDDVNFIPRGWINRNRILSFGKSIYVTVPLQHASPNKLICDTSIAQSNAWQDKMLKSIEYTYSRAPYYHDVFLFIEKLIRHESVNLAEYLVHQLQSLSRFLGISTNFVSTSRCYRNEDLNGKERVLDICRIEGADTIINPQGGQHLYAKEDFAQLGIDLRFLVPRDTKYKQFGTSFVPSLSIIDVMMFNSQMQLDRMLSQFELV